MARDSEFPALSEEYSLRRQIDRSRKVIEMASSLLALLALSGAISAVEVLASEAADAAMPIRKLQHIRFFGNQDVKEGHLRKQCGLMIGKPWNDQLVETARKKLEEYCRDKGYNNIKVKVLEGDREIDRGVVFLVNEGDDRTICRAEFVGKSAPDGRQSTTKLQATPRIAFCG